MTIYQRLIHYIYLPRLEKLGKEIGCKLLFHGIPDGYINGIMSCEMTKTWKRFGLDIERGQNYFTMGKVVNGMSSRFDRNAAEYQSWLGGYTVKLASEKKWSLRDHFKLAIADQNRWLGWYGDPNPKTNIDGWKFIKINKVQLGQCSGMLYKCGCRTHSDIGPHYNSVKLRFASKSIAALFNLSNPSLALQADAFIPKASASGYEPLDLKGYIAIVDIKPRVKAILYGNGAAVLNSSSKTDTFALLKEDILNAMKCCEIIQT
jgi:hypothetical protein